MADDKYLELIAKYLSGNMELREKEELVSWMSDHPDNKALFDSSETIWDLADQADTDFAVDIDNAWLDFEEKLDDTPVVSIPVLQKEKRRSMEWWRIAAAAVFIIGVGYTWQTMSINAQPSLVEMVSPMDEQLFVDLPDGTQVWLNKNSKLTYEADFKERKVELEGEAFFDVVRDETHPFRITSGFSETKVLGTSFNVRAYKAEKKIEVTVETGVVELSNLKAPENKIELVKGTSGYYDKKDEVVKESTDKISNAQSWRTKKLAFDDIAMSDVTLAMERYFDIEIDLAGSEIANCPFFGTYEDSNLKLENIFQAMEFVYDVEIVENNGKYIIEGGSCSSK